VGRYGGQNANQGMTNQPREPSVKPQADWIELETMDFASLAKMTLPASAIPEAKDLAWAGSLEPYDEDYDRIGAKTARKLKECVPPTHAILLLPRHRAALSLPFALPLIVYFPHPHPHPFPVPRRYPNKDFPLEVPLRKDTIIQSIAAEGFNDGVNVFVSDSVLAHIMACTRSAYPWDIVVWQMPTGSDERIIMLDSRSPLHFDMHTVNETGPNPPSEADPSDANGREQLQIEATSIHQNVSQMVLLPNNKTGPAVEKETKPLPGEPALQPSPFADPETTAEGRAPASLAFRYRSWALPGGIRVVARTTVHSVIRKRATPQYLSVYSVMEAPAAAGASATNANNDWRRMIDNQRGALIATEIKNNAMKLAKFTIQSLLAGVDSMRLAFVSRQTKSDSHNHVVLGMQTSVPATFANQLALNQANMWAIVRWLIDTVRKHADNLQDDDAEEEPMKFVFMRDPVKNQVKLYNVPVDSFQEEDEEGGEEDGEEGEAGAQPAEEN
jgi:translation initiation factor 3 subunit D